MNSDFGKGESTNIKVIESRENLALSVDAIQGSEIIYIQNWRSATMSFDETKRLEFKSS